MGGRQAGHLCVERRGRAGGEEEEEDMGGSGRTGGELSSLLLLPLPCLLLNCAMAITAFLKFLGISLPFSFLPTARKRRSENGKRKRTGTELYVDDVLHTHAWPRGETERKARRGIIFGSSCHVA